MRPSVRDHAFALLCLAGLSGPAFAQAAAPDETPSKDSAASATIQVTATRVPEAVDPVPASISVITGEELEKRNVHTLAGALALVGGVSVAPGGDGGPASSVPEMWGLREFDASSWWSTGFLGAAPSTRRSRRSTSPTSSASK